MGRVRINLEGRFVIAGADVPMRTLYAQLYKAGEDDNDPPVKAVGYHPWERADHERTEHGVYPCQMHKLAETLAEWGLTEEERARVLVAVSHDPDMRAAVEWAQ